MVDIVELCESDRFLAGGCEEYVRTYEFPSKQPWQRRVTGVVEYLSAIRRVTADESSYTAWHALEERYLPHLMGVVDKITSIGFGPIICEVDEKRNALSERLSTHERIRNLAENVGRVAQIDGERLLVESLGETPYGHLDAALALGMLVPDVVFPLIAVLVEAYREGFMPYGVFNMSVDPEYCGPNVLLCIDPANLSLK